MKSRNLLGLCSLLALFSACGNGAPKYDATGTFETTEVLVSAEASGRLLYFDIEEGMLLKAGEEVGVVDTVQLYLKKLQPTCCAKLYLIQQSPEPDVAKFIRRYSGGTGGRPVEEVSHHLSDNRHCTGKVCRSGRTHSYGHSAFQSGRYGADVSSCLHHLRTTVAGKAGTESNRLLRLRHR